MKNPTPSTKMPAPMSVSLKAEKSKTYSNISLDNALVSCGMSEADKNLTAILFYGVTEKKIALDYIISKLSSRDIDKIDLEALVAVRMGIYQLKYMDRIPAHAAINESVSLCPKKLSGFANAILREYTRRNEIPLPDKSDFAYYLSVKYSVCKEIADKFIEVFGKEKSEDILSGFNDKVSTTICTNTLKISRDGLMDKLSAAKTENAPLGLYVTGSVREMFGFDDGLFFVQDQASQICVQALGACEGETVMDICSCPGSKSFGAAITMNNKGKIYSFDLHENKLSLIRSGAERLGINIIEASAADGRNFIEKFENTADRVLCDVPCSGFGVLAKKPELRFKDPQLSARLPQIQFDILSNASRYVKSGGTLVYSTCTILPTENEDVIKRFLETNSDFSLSDWSVGNIHAADGMITLYPNIHHTDGFFIAKLIRK